MKYAYALKYIDSFESAGNGVGFSSQRLSELCSRLGRINIGSGFIHVPGGGAGHAVSRLIDSMIRRAGYRVGLITAALDFDIRSTVYVDGESPDIDEFIKLVGVIKETVGKENKDRYSKEEIAVAYALLVCKLEGCDFVVLEDSFRTPGIFSVCMPFDIAVVPTLYGELTEGYLSAIKQGTREVVSGDQRHDIHSYLVKKCSAEGVRLSFPMRTQFTLTSSSCRSIEFAYKGKTGYLLRSASYMLRDSALTAIEVAHAIRRAGIKLPGNAMVDGIKDAKDAGCFALLSSSPTIITDVSTTRGEILYLAKNLVELPETVRTGKKTLCFCADVEDDARNAIEAFSNVDLDEILCVGACLDEIKKAVPEGCSFVGLTDIEAAAEKIAHSNELDRLYLCFGSVPFAEAMKSRILRSISGI